MPQSPAHDFLAGGGEMGARMRAMDWSQTPLGPADAWPQSLRSAVSIMLPSRAQIALFWGKDLITLYNDAYKPVLGAKDPQSLGRPVREVWAELWDTGLKDLFHGVLETGTAFWASDRPFLMHRHGYPEETFFDISYDPIRDESGAVAGLFCIVSDTTARVVGERRLALLKDLAARNATARSVREACALAMQTLTGRIPFALAYVDGRLEACTAGAEEALAQAKPEMVREFALETPGAPARLVAGLNPLRPYDEQYRSFLGLVADQIRIAISNAQAYEAERKRAEALAELDRAKTVFFSNVSHEFRTPLTLMLAPLEDVLANEALPEQERRRLLELAHRNGRRMLKLVNTLLDFARIEAGRAQASYERTDLAALTTELASNFRAACEKAGLELRVRCEDPVEGYVDRDMWEKIVLNLLSNAFKYTLQGSIEVGIRTAGDVLELAVRDTGIGIPQESLERVFERFHRVEGARGRSQEGTGIGLALVQELVRLHGGSIAAESASGGGSSFTVRIPAGMAHLPAERVGSVREMPGSALTADAYVAEALGWLPDENAGAAPHTGAGAARVLVADDNADLRDYVRRLLAEHYEVETVADGAQALAAARARRPDVVLSDVMMPQLDGFGLIAELRADPGLHDIPVILLSARAGEEARIEGLNRGADDYLVKPFSARELLVRVGALLQSQELRRRSLEALRESELRFRQLFESMDEGYCVIEVLFDADDHPVDYRFLETNPAFERQTGLADAKGRRMRELRPQHEQHWFDVYGRIAKSGETLRFENQAAALGRWYDVCAFRVGAPELRRVGVVFNDITSRKRSEQALREMDRRKDEFLAMLSHELRNPLGPLRNALDVLQVVGAAGDTAVRARAIMDRQLSHLVRLVDDLLEMARINRGALELRRERVSIEAVMRSAVETAEPLLRAGRHRLQLALPDEALWVDGDPVRLAQLVANLLNNSAKYTPQGGSIELRASADGQDVVVAVRDDGMGIAPEALSRIFEMFTRDARGPGGTDSGGLGIGLALSRQIAELHGGTLEARSEGAGRGSEFVLRLPRAAAPAAAVSEAREPSALLPGMRVLVVDDNRDAAASLAMVLRGLGAETELAHDGAGALAAHARFRPDAVFLDIGMPGMDGYEVARALRASAEARSCALVALTGWGQEADRRRAREAGFDHHLVKPARMDTLRELLAAIGAAQSTLAPVSRTTLAHFETSART